VKPIHEEQEAFTPEQIAYRYLPMNAASVRRHCRSGDLKAKRVSGKTYLITLEAIREFAAPDEQQKQPTRPQKIVASSVAKQRDRKAQKKMETTKNDEPREAEVKGKRYI
jgi:hypothetical protein